MKQLLLLILTITLTGVCSAQQSANEKREKYSWTLGYKPDRVVEFYEPKPDAPLKLHLFFPEDYQPSDKLPCIVLFFGGAWKGGSPEQFYGISKYLASRGMVAISAQYRTMKQKAIPRNCVEDGREAVRYIREHALELGIDPQKIAAGGGSAGGHVAAAVAMCDRIDAAPESGISSLPNALVLFNPVYHNGPEGYGNARVSAYWQEISPYHNIRKGLPPTVVFFGTEDSCITVPIMNDFQTAMEQAGNDCVTHIYKDEFHGFFHISKGGRKVFQDVLSKVDKFLVRQQFLTGEENVKAWTAEAIEHYTRTKPKKVKAN